MFDELYQEQFAIRSDVESNELIDYYKTKRDIFRSSLLESEAMMSYHGRLLKLQKLHSVDN